MDRQLELELVARLRNRDADAFDQVYAAWNGRLFGFLARLSRSRDAAEDLLEETWLRLVRHTDRLEADTSLGPWLFTVARNLFVSYCRSRALDESVSAGLGLWPTSVAASPFESTAASQLEARLEHAIASLPARFREVLLLVGVEGLTPSEAARICGVTPETMRQRLKRARAALMSKLEEQTAAAAGELREVRS